MTTGPRPLTRFLNTSDGITNLLNRSREQRELLSLVAAELEPTLREHLIAALSKGPLLLLYVDSTAWASRLRFESRSLRKRLAGKGQDFGKVKVKILIDRPARGTRHAAGPRRLNRLSTEVIRQLAQDIEDPELRCALERLARHGRESA